jgi:hypothetical protein
MRSTLIAFVEDSVTEGRDGDMMRGEEFGIRCRRKKMIEIYLLLHLFPIRDDMVMGLTRSPNLPAQANT